MENNNPNEPIVRDEKYMQMFDEWLRKKKEEEQVQAGESAASEPGKGNEPAWESEEQRRLEAERIAEEQRRLEAERIAEEQRRLEAERIAEEQRRLEAQRQTNQAGYVNSGDRQPTSGNTGGWDGNFNPPSQPPRPPKPPKKSGTGKKVWILIGILVAGIALGVLVTLLCTSPSLFVGSWNARPAQSQQDPQPSASAADQDSQPSANQNNGTGEAPDLDGKTPTITDYTNPVPEIAENVAPGVVGVTAAGVQKAQEPNGEDTIVKSRGTGFIISTDGYIVTNNHVVEGRDSFVVTMQDGTEYEAKYIGSDSTLDIAVLKIEAEGLTALSIGDSDSVKVGELAVAIGNPQGAGQNLTGTVSVGYISAVNRELMFNNSKQKFLQTDAAMNPGNSGGPLVNAKGEVIGVVTLKSLISTVSSDGSTVATEGIGFAIPINSAIQAANEIIETGTVSKPGIGIYGAFINEEVASQNQVVSGMIISDFMEVSPAYEAGMRQGDIITEYDGNKVETGDDLIAYIKEKKVGDQITFKVWREGKEMTMKVTLENTNNG